MHYLTVVYFDQKLAVKHRYFEDMREREKMSSTRFNEKSLLTQVYVKIGRINGI